MFFYPYANELTALIKSGVDPQNAVKLADAHVGNYEKCVNEVAQQRESERQANTRLNAYNNELVALIKSGVSPKEAVEIARSHSGNYEKCVKEVTKQRQARELDPMQK